MIALDLDSYRLAFTTLINTGVNLGEMIREVVGGAGSELINRDEFKNKKLRLTKNSLEYSNKNKFPFC